MTPVTRKFSILLALALPLAGPAMAAEETSNLSVSAVVLDTCTLTAATALSFASINTSTASNQVTPGALAVVCTANQTGLTVALGAGENASGSTRKMASTEGNELPYGLFSDAGHSSAIGIGENVFSGNTAAAVPLAIPVYGQIPAGNYNAGLYSDTILVTLTYGN